MPEVLTVTQQENVEYKLTTGNRPALERIMPGGEKQRLRAGELAVLAHQLLTENAALSEHLAEDSKKISELQEQVIALSGKLDDVLAQQPSKTFQPGDRVSMVIKDGPEAGYKIIGRDENNPGSFIVQRQGTKLTYSAHPQYLESDNPAATEPQILSPAQADEYQPFYRRRWNRLARRLGQTTFGRSHEDDPVEVIDGQRYIVRDNEVIDEIREDEDNRRAGTIVLAAVALIGGGLIGAYFGGKSSVDDHEGQVKSLQAKNATLVAKNSRLTEANHTLSQRDRAEAAKIANLKGKLTTTQADFNNFRAQVSGEFAGQHVDLYNANKGHRLVGVELPGNLHLEKVKGHDIIVDNSGRTVVRHFKEGLWNSQGNLGRRARQRLRALGYKVSVLTFGGRSLPLVTRR